MTAGRHGAAARSLRAGAAATLAAALALATTAPHWPDWPVLETLARLLESPLPQITAAAVAMGWLAARAGARRLGAALALASAAMGIGTALARHLPPSLPATGSAEAGITVLWANLLWSNPTPPERLVAALVESPAEIVILGEGAPLEGHLPALAAHFPQMAGCGMARRCEMLVLSRRRGVAIALPPMPDTRPGRMARIRVPGESGPALTLVGLHLLKPWFGDMAEYDDALAMEELGRHAGPVAVVGDFNAAPWSARMQRIARACALSWPRRVPGTWPAPMGAAGVPIDLALAGRGARIAAIAPWPVPGSDHRGLLLRLEMPAETHGETHGETLERMAGERAGAAGGPAAPPATCRAPEALRRQFGL